MKNTLKQIFHDKKFIMGFIIFIAILATIIIYPLVVAYSPLEMVGGLFYKPGTYVSVSDTVESKNYSFKMDTSAVKLESALSMEDRSQMGTLLENYAGVDIKDIDVTDAKGLIKLWEKYEVAELSVPDLTTDGQLCLNLGECNLEISFVGHAHTPGDMVVYLPDEEILFAGDVLFNGCHPVTRSANTSNWVNVLAKLKQKSIKLTVPGHGDPSIGKSNLDNLQNYFEVFRARVGELKASGLSVEEVVESFALPEFESWGKKNWLPVSIKKIYSELV